MKIMASISIIALGLVTAGGASAHDRRPHYDALYGIGAQPRTDSTGTARTSVLPGDPDEHQTLTGGPSGGLPDLN